MSLCHGTTESDWACLEEDAIADADTAGGGRDNVRPPLVAMHCRALPLMQLFLGGVGGWMGGWWVTWCRLLQAPQVSGDLVMASRGKKVYATDHDQCNTKLMTAAACMPFMLEAAAFIAYYELS